MDAREYFESVRDAARGMARCLARMEAMRSREGLRGGTLTARGGGCGDPMAATDARVDAEREAETARVHGPENGGSEKNGRHRKKSPGERQRVGGKSCATPTERTF